MQDEIYKRTFSKNLRYYMEKNGKSQVDLINDLGLNRSAVSTWCNGTRLPRMDKVDALAKYFNINRSDLIEDHTDIKHNDPDPEVVAKAMELYKRYDSLPPEMQKEFQDYLAFLQSKSAPPQ